MKLNLWQSNDWKKFQEKLGFKTHYFEVHFCSALIIQRALPFGFSYFYCSRGPVSSSDYAVDGLMLKIRESASEKSVIFTRIDPFTELNVDDVGLIVKSESHQPRATLKLNLSMSEDELLAQMKQKGRYNIRLASKNGVRIVIVDKTDVRDFEDGVYRFYSLLEATTERDGFSSHDMSYYQKFLEEISVSELMLAYRGDHCIAGGIFCFDRDVALYYYGASDHDERHLMAPYLLQWEAICEAKKRGCTQYDFLGISDSCAPQKGWEGITAFKKKFGGDVTVYPQAIDVVYRPFLYFVFRFLKMCQSTLRVFRLRR